MLPIFYYFLTVQATLFSYKTLICTCFKSPLSNKNCQNCSNSGQCCCLIWNTYTMFSLHLEVRYSRRQTTQSCAVFFLTLHFEDENKILSFAKKRFCPARITFFCNLVAVYMLKWHTIKSFSLIFTISVIHISCLQKAASYSMGQKVQKKLELYTSFTNVRQLLIPLSIYKEFFFFEQSLKAMIHAYKKNEL